ncbi:MAG: methylated-DNA--[protein]-cysteine S-methyltransferase [Proteobacteria bacterium]|nr:MAG: methylated-DNA--[protein]-cysteine S-methyltransferase [Pseudomonadota bacterium]
MNPTQYGLRFDTPLGVCQVRANAAALLSACFDEADCPLPANALCHEAARQITAYLAGERRDFDLPLAPEGTPFQQTVWAALRRLPYGATTHYGALAATLGRPTAARAIGAAVGKNPLWLIIPCHRVIGRDGSLTGYAGGLPRKRALLDLEAARATT